MEFDRIARLTGRTQTGELCEAWQTSASDVVDCTQGKRPMTLREVGALAELHGLKLLDVLAV